MTKKKLHPSVEQFKQFVKKNPKIIREVRNGNATWQELYEEWYLLGEDDIRWDGLREEKEEHENKSNDHLKDWFTKIKKTMNQMDPNELQRYITNISEALGAIQGLISQFQGEKKEQPKMQERSLFPFQKD